MWAPEQEHDSQRGERQLEHDAADVDRRLPAHLPSVNHVRAHGAGAEYEAATASGAAAGRILSATSTSAAADGRGGDEHGPVAFIGVAYTR